VIGHIWGVVSVGGNIFPALQVPIIAIVLCSIGGVFNAITTAVPFALISLAVSEERTCNSIPSFHLYSCQLLIWLLQIWASMLE